MGKWELTMNPVQEWCDESEDGVVYGVTLRRTPLSPRPGGGGDANDDCPGSAFVKYRTCKVRRLKAATLERLVSHLLEPGCQDQDYCRIFLSTYRTFTSTATLIQMLFQRDNAASDMDNSECYWSPVLTLLQTWLDEYSEDFRSPPLHSPLRLLLDHLQISAAVSTSMRCQPNYCSLAGQAEELLKRFQKEEMETTRHSAQADVEQEEGHSGSEGLDSETDQEAGDIMDFPVHAIAEQLTRLDSALFVKLVPYQCLGCVWSQRDKKPNMSPTTRATIAQFNAVTNRVITSLLCRPTPATASPPSSRRTPTSPAQRARIIEKWIRVAQECRQLKNLSSLRAVLSALQSNAVYRLRKTWAAVNRESMATFDNLWETFPDENCVLSNREILVEDRSQPALDNVSPKWCPISKQMSPSSGVVPYLGTYLTVLTMLDTALPDNLEGGLINFEKRRREFEILSQIHVLQASCSQYNLPQHPRINAWLREHKMLTDLESYELSIRLEPPVDLCSPGPWSHRSLTKKLTSLLTVNDSSKKMLADQISVSSSGSSGSDMEDLSSTGGCSIRLQPLSLSCNNVSEAFSSSSSSSSSSSTSSPCSSADSSMESPSSSSSSSCSSSSSQPDLCAPPALHHLSLPVCSSSPSSSSTSPSPKRSVSMTMLPVYNRQVADSCIVRVSVDLGTNNGNMYKSILLTSQDKTAQVIQRALEKHHLDHMSEQEFTLTQLISPGRELLIPDKANVFYAMSTAANFDFVLRKFSKGQKTPLRATCSLGRYTK